MPFVQVRSLLLPRSRFRLSFPISLPQTGYPVCGFLYHYLLLLGRPLFAALLRVCVFPLYGLASDFVPKTLLAVFRCILAHCLTAYFGAKYAEVRRYTSRDGLKVLCAL